MSEEEIQELTLEKLASEMLRCKLSTTNKIKEIEDSLVEIQLSIRKAESDRSNSSDMQNKIFEQQEEIVKSLQHHQNRFNEHDTNEMEKYERIVQAIKDLKHEVVVVAQETDINTIIIEHARREEDVQRRIQEALEEKEKPNKELWHKVKMTAVSVISGAIVSGMIAGILLMYDLYKMINGGE